MARQLVVCLDGTGNRFSHRPTNVLRLVRSLPDDRLQTLVYYDQGVGTFGLKETLFEWQKVPARVCGLAFGWGLRQLVERAYRFLAENAQPVDEIYIFGFSRGAFAARALAALVHAVGLVPGHAGHLFDPAWSLLSSRTVKKPAPDGRGQPECLPDFELLAQFKQTFGRPTRIHFLGLYDTVKSVGWIYDPVVIPFTARNPSVERVRHAVSIDERRCFFRQNLWSTSSGPQKQVKEVWFAGVHSDIGGGYPPEEAGLALVAFRWMMGEALAAGLRVDAARLRSQLCPPDGTRADPQAQMHDSMQAPWKIAEWVPRLVWQGPARGRRLELGAMPPLRKPRPRFMHSEPTLLVHRSVELRRAARPDYRPPNWPDDRAVSVEDDDPVMAQFP